MNRSFPFDHVNAAMAGERLNPKTGRRYPPGTPDAVKRWPQPRPQVRRLGPVISAVAPNTGPAAGGTAVTITGLRFPADSAITFGGLPATSVVVVSATQIAAVTPAGVVGPVHVALTSASHGTGASLENGFAYS